MKAKISAPSAVTTRASVLEGRASIVEVVEATIERISTLEPRIHAWQSFDPELALAYARTLERRRDAGEPTGMLTGVPLAVKDIFDTADLPTTYGSPIYSGARPSSDAYPVAVARAAGAVMMGKTVTTEFAYFTPGPTANPWNTEHTPGGSSSGSAAAVASGMVPLAFGSQTAGSLIRPASYCGVFALKATYGAISLQGAKPFSHSLDTMGWLARSADDLELMRCALLGESFELLVVPPIASLNLAASTTHEASYLDDGRLQTWHGGLERLAAAGAKSKDLAVPESLRGLLDAQKAVMAYEAARSLEREVREHRNGLSASMLALLQSGVDMPEARYREAQTLAAEGRKQVAALMQGLDALIVPAAPGEAPAGLAATGDPVFSRVWTLLGLPCINVPGLLGPQGLPVGLQLVGHRGQERRLLAVAAALHGALRAC